MSDGVIRLRLPATSANLGPGFDALGLAMGFHLHVEATRADEIAIVATGRDVPKISDTRDSLVLSTCRDVLGRAAVPMPQVSLRLHNEIPLGMGCGSSAAALVAGVALANRLGDLRWTAQEVLAEASRREGHPDNVAACVLGGFTASAMRGAHVDALSLAPPQKWQILLVLPNAGLATRSARALLPDSYSRADAVTNVQNVALLTAAFATGDARLLRDAMTDRMHQPYREAVCPLLPKLLPMAQREDVLGVALSGAGPSVLLLVAEDTSRGGIEDAVRGAIEEQTGNVELLWTRIGNAAVL